MSDAIQLSALRDAAIKAVRSAREAWLWARAGSTTRREVDAVCELLERCAIELGDNARVTARKRASVHLPSLAVDAWLEVDAWRRAVAA
jgi:hypothetical protein